MAESARVGYLQARLQARHGQRPGEVDWRLIESSVDLLHYLDAVRATALKRWVRGVSPDSSAAEIEMLLRANWRDGVVQASTWAPGPWREMLLWCRWLPELPVLAHLLDGGGVRAWMRSDPVIRSFAFDDPGACLSALADTELAPMQPLLQAGEGVRSAWQSVLCDLVPGTVSSPAGDALEQLDRLLEGHRVAMLEAPEQGDGQALRKELGARFLRVFRRAAGTAAVVFAFLGLEALEAERVRAGLVTRRLLRRVPEGLTWA
ncbi:hypothetical protein [Wenzhouxiangella limi]|uniref:Uncharacterized protein n=1 Tax=Wenzhouxiangella limi TaxID=2707351 RepID=A0A845VAZ9_9GAMM|nr:hypothetical protein [Wenzhouxiangella limi]NDY97075.1 hypothetical protein [Wenzhouxiangella limi]